MENQIEQTRERLALTLIFIFVCILLVLFVIMYASREDLVEETTIETVAETTFTHSEIKEDIDTSLTSSTWIMFDLDDRGEEIIITPSPTPIEYNYEYYRVITLEVDDRNDYESCLRVASVIQNRITSPNYPNSVYGVISQSGQFCVWTLDVRPSITDIVEQAGNDALIGNTNLPPYVLYFCTPSAYQRSQFFQTLEIYDEYGGHVWCYAQADKDAYEAGL